MKTFAIHDGDINIENGDIKMIDSADEMAQSVFVALSTFKGEWFLDPDFGLDSNKMTGKTTDAQMRSTVIAELGKHPRVGTIEEVIITHEGRTVNLYFKVQTVDGDVVENEVNNIA